MHKLWGSVTIDNQAIEDAKKHTQAENDSIAGKVLIDAIDSKLKEIKNDFIAYFHKIQCDQKRFRKRRSRAKRRF